MLKKWIIVLLVIQCISSFGNIVLVKKHIANSTIVFNSKEKVYLKYAQILQEYIVKSSGAKLPINSTSFPNKIRLQISEVNHSDIEEFSFTFPNNSTIVISGGSENGLKFGIYRFLEKYLGLKRLFPGKLGDFLPKYKDIIVKRENYVDKPAYLSRYLGSGAYSKETSQYYDWIRSLGSNNPRIYMGHYLFALLSPSKYGKNHPEFYPEFNGKRVVPTSGQTTFWQPCFTALNLAEELAKNVIKKLDKTAKNKNSSKDPRNSTVSLGVNDAGGFCTCKNCQKVNGNTLNYTGNISASSSYLALINKVANIVTTQYPNCKLPFLAYSSVAEIPPHFGKLNPRLIPEIAYDSMYTADDKLKNNFRRVFNSWGKSLDELALGDYVYGKYFLLPRTNFKTIHEQVTWAYKHKARHYYGESYPGNDWAEGPKLYLLIKLLWNPLANKDAILKEWYTCCVGKKAAPYLEKYFTNLEKFWTQDVVKTSWFQEKRVYPSFGSSDYLVAYTEKELLENENLLKKCCQLAQTPLEKARAEYFLNIFLKRKEVIKGFWKVKKVKNLASFLNFSERIYTANFDPYPKKVSFWQRANRKAKFLQDANGGTNYSNCLLINADGSFLGPSLYEIKIPVQNKRSFRITVMCRAESNLNSNGEVILQSYWRNSNGKMLSNTYRVSEKLPPPYDNHWKKITVYNTTPFEGNLTLCVGLCVNKTNQGIVRFDDVIVDATPIKFSQEEKYKCTILNEDFSQANSIWPHWQSGKDKNISFTPTINNGINNSPAIMMDFAKDKENNSGIYTKTIPIVNQKNLLLSCQIKLSKNCNFNAIGQLSITYLDKDKKVLNTNTTTSSTLPQRLDGKFHKVAFCSTVPDKAALVKISLIGRKAAPGKIWFDNLEIKTIN